MSEKIYVVKYTGPFGFIKPWTAVRDSETFSQQFLTESIVEGIEKKLFPGLLKMEGIKKIQAHRINYKGLSIQQERTWAKGGFKVSKNKKQWKTNLGIINRGVMIMPHLYLAFSTIEDATHAGKQTVCLCRNEDLVFPEEILHLTIKEFEEVDGFELEFTDSKSGFKVGHNRYHENKEMYGNLKVIGNPIRRD